MAKNIEIPVIGYDLEEASGGAIPAIDDLFDDVVVAAELESHGSLVRFVTCKALDSHT